MADANSLAAQKLAYRMRLIQSELIVDARNNSTKLQNSDKAQKPKGSKKQDEASQQSLEESQQDDEPILVSAD